MEQVSGQERKSRNTAAEELSDNIETIEKTASVVVKGEREAVYCLSVIGQIEGHYLLPEGQKATKYEQLIPLLVSVEEDERMDGLLVVLNTMGGDVEAGLALAELDRIHAQTDRHAGSGRRTFHRCSACRGRAEILHSSVRHHDHPSGAHQRDCHRRSANLPMLSGYAGQNHHLHLCAQPDQ